MKHLIKVVFTGFAVLVTLVVSGSIFAAGTTINEVIQGISFTPPATDLSIGFLAKLFGDVPGVIQLTGVGSSIIGAIFSVFNVGVLGLSGVFIAFTVGKILTESGMDGSTMGKSSTVWTAVRCALSTSLLVPQTTGYTMINSIILWMVVQGVGLADLTWNRALEYLKGGGTAHASASYTIDYSLINYTGGGGSNETGGENIGSADVLRSLSCAYTVHSAIMANQKANYDRLVAKQENGETLTSEELLTFTNASKEIAVNSGVFSVYKRIDAECQNSDCNSYRVGTGVYVFPYIEDEASNPLKDYGLSLDSNEIPKNLTGSCGYISYNTTNLTGDKNKLDRYLVAKEQGLRGMVGMLEPIAKELVELFTPKEGNKPKLEINTYEIHAGQTLFKDNSATGLMKYSPKNQIVSSYKGEEHPPGIILPLGTEEILGAAVIYQSDLAPVQGAVPSGKEMTEAVVAEAKSSGWVAAGGYYNLLSQKADSLEKEYNYYRLIGATDANISNSTRNTNYGAMIDSKVFDLVATIDSTASNVLVESLIWVNLAYPWSFELGRSMEVEDKDRSVAPLELETGKIVSSDERFDIELSIGGTATMLAIPLVNVGAIFEGFDIPIRILKYSMSKVIDGWRGTKEEVGKEVAVSDPIMGLQKLGNLMIESAYDAVHLISEFYIATASATLILSGAGATTASIAAVGTFMGTTMGVIEAAEALMSMGSEGSSVFKGIINLYMPLTVAVIGTMFVTGATLSIYVPLIPYLLFMFGALSWLISVIVLVAASPIICFLMLWSGASQDNPFISREMEQFFLQVIGIFFRPTLMVIGLVVGMMLSYIGIDILNMGFDNIFKIVTAGTKNEVSTVTHMGMVVVYVFCMVSLVNLCFSTIYLLYSEAMRLVGVSAPAVGMEERHADAVKSGLAQFTDSSAAGMKEGATSMRGVGGTLKISGMAPGITKRKEAKKNEESEAPTVTTGNTNANDKTNNN